MSSMSQVFHTKIYMLHKFKFACYVNMYIRMFINVHTSICGLPQWLSCKEVTCNAGNLGDPGSVPGLGRSPGEKDSNPLQYSCLETPWTEECGGLQSIGSQKVRHN